MASPFDSGETLSQFRAGDLASAISEGTVSEEMLERYAQEGCLDVPDKDGQTPLMLACLAGLEDVVKFLLSNGANPSSKSLKEGNTPMHYACMVEDTTEDESLTGQNYKPTKWMIPKVSIVKLLLSSGALVVQNNLNGWSPPCVAALYMLKDVADFFLAMDDDILPLEEKIKATEILGVSQATQANDDYGLNDAFHSFCRAITLQQDAGVRKGQPETSELAASFLKINLKEFHKLDEIRSTEPSQNELIMFHDEKGLALKAHAFLVGERLFSTSLKQKYFFPSLLGFASFIYLDRSYEEKTFERGFQLFSCVLSFERLGELQLGSVASYLVRQAQFRINPYLKYMLCAYDSVLNNVRLECLLDSCHSLMEDLGVILYHEATSGPSFDMLTSTVQYVEQLLRIIQGRICRESPDDYPRMPSVSLKIMTYLMQRYSSYGAIGRLSLLSLKFVLLRLLLYDNVSYQDESSGYTLLHTVASCVYSPRLKGAVGHLVDLARAFVRHGCPPGAVNIDGETARETFEHGSHRWKVDPFQSLLSPPTTVLRLEEAAARVVLRHKINYQDLPRRLRDVVEGGVSESDLETLITASRVEDSDDEESLGTSEDDSDEYE